MLWQELLRWQSLTTSSNKPATSSLELLVISDRYVGILALPVVFLLCGFHSRAFCFFVAHARTLRFQRVLTYNHDGNLLYVYDKYSLI